jgi:hypothetical protein
MNRSKPEVSTLSDVHTAFAFSSMLIKNEAKILVNGKTKTFQTGRLSEKSLATGSAALPHWILLS